MARRAGKIGGCFLFVVCAAFGVIAVVVLGLIWVGSAMPDATDPASSPVDAAARAARAEAAQAILNELAESGALRKVDAASCTVWLDPTAWAASNRDTKEAAIRSLAACMEALTGNNAVTVRSYANDAVLGKYGIMGAKILR